MADQLAWDTPQFFAVLATILAGLVVGISIPAWWDKHRKRAATIIARRTEQAARTKGFVAIEDPTTVELDPQPLYVADCGQMAALPADLFEVQQPALVPERRVGGHQLVAGCTCPWNNGYHVNDLGHHVACPSLKQRHTWNDQCDVNGIGGHYDDEPAPTLREERIGQRMGDVHPNCLAARANAATDLICAECAAIFAQVGS